MRPLDGVPLTPAQYMSLCTSASTALLGAYGSYDRTRESLLRRHEEIRGGEDARVSVVELTTKPGRDIFGAVPFPVNPR